eukprot:jgi/Tetstr1/420817/TSEL_011893.t1
MEGDQSAAEQGAAAMADEAMAADSTGAAAPMLRPLTEFVPEKAHEIMAMQLDPRYCKGNLFKLMLGKQEEARELMHEGIR